MPFHAQSNTDRPALTLVTNHTVARAGHAAATGAALAAVDPNHPGPATKARPAKVSKTARFLEFHHANPQVWRTLVRLAREWRFSGRQKCAIALLYNRARWELTLAVSTEDNFQMNDHHQAFYARALMHFHPELDGMFDLRTSEADEWARTLRPAVVEAPALRAA